MDFDDLVIIVLVVIIFAKRNFSSLVNIVLVVALHKLYVLCFYFYFYYVSCFLMWVFDRVFEFDYGCLCAVGSDRI